MTAPANDRDTPGHLLVISGYSAAGKTTIGRELARRRERAIHIDGDVIQRLVVSGSVTMEIPPPPGALDQLRLRFAAALAVADLIRVAIDTCSGRYTYDSLSGMAQTSPPAAAEFAPVAVVTGGSRGIGAATAERPARDGYCVAVHYRTDSTAADMVVARIRQNGGDASSFQAELTRPDAGRGFWEAYDHAAGDRRGQRIRTMINNAGVSVRGPIEELTGGSLLQQQQINQVAPAHSKPSRGSWPNISDLAGPRSTRWLPGSSTPT